MIKSINTLAHLLAISLVALGCQQSRSGSTTDTPQDSTAQVTQMENTAALVAGSDSALHVTCSEEGCEFVYAGYTVTTRSRQEAPGEVIAIIHHTTKIQTTLEIKEAEGAQYFVGMVGKYVLIDIGTGNIRKLAVYDLSAQSVATLLNDIVNDAFIRDKQLNYTVLLTTDNATGSKLPPCSGTTLEMSGYTELMRYNFKTRKSISTQTYDCIQ